LNKILSFRVEKDPPILAAICQRADTLRTALCEHQTRAEACREAIRHLDFVIAHCDPQIEYRKVSRRFTTHVRHLKPGMITRLVMTVLRRAERPISAREILIAVSQELGTKSTRIGLRRLDNAIRSSLKCKEREGFVISEKAAGGPQRFWIVGSNG
jgi:hypothetical protein